MFSEQYTNDVFKTLRKIHFLCSFSGGLSVRHMIGGLFKSIKKGKNEVTTSTWDSIHQITVVPKNWQDFL